MTDGLIVTGVENSNKDTKFFSGKIFSTLLSIEKQLTYLSSEKIIKLLLLFIIVIFFSYHNIDFHQFDLSINYISVKLFLSHKTKNIYDMLENSKNEHLIFIPYMNYIRFHNIFNSFVSSPATIFLYYPLTLLRFSVARFAWLLINILLIYLSILLLSKKSSFYLIMTSIIFIFYSFIQVNLGFGQTSIIMMILLILLRNFLIDKSKYGAGISIAFLAAIKIFPILFVFLLIIKRRFKEVIIFSLILITIFSFSVKLIGVNSFLYWINVVIPELVKGEHSSYDQGVPSLIYHLVREKNGYFLQISRVISVLLFLLTIFISIMLFNKSDYSRESISLELSLWIIMSLLVIPLCWTHYYTILIIPIVTLFEYSFSRIKFKRYYFFIVFIIVFYLMILPMYPGELNSIAKIIPRKFWISKDTYLCFLLYLIFVSVIFFRNYKLFSKKLKTLKFNKSIFYNSISKIQDNFIFWYLLKIQRYRDKNYFK